MLLAVPVTAHAASSGSTFCVGFNVVSNDGRTIDTDAECAVASTGDEGEDGDGDAGGGVGTSEEGETVVDDTVNGGYRGSRDRVRSRILDLLRWPLQPAPIRRYRPAASAASGSVVARPRTRLVPGIIGRFYLRFRPSPPSLLVQPWRRYRLEWRDVAPALPKGGTSLHGAWSSFYLMRLASPEQKSETFWQLLGLWTPTSTSMLAHEQVRAAAIYPVRVTVSYASFSDELCDISRCEGAMCIAVALGCDAKDVGSALVASVGIPDIAFFRVYPSELIMWILLSLLIAGMLLCRAWKRTHPGYQPTLWEDGEDGGS